MLLLVSARFASSEDYGYIPDGKAYLGSGFDPTRPQTVFPLCVKSAGECQIGATDSVACLGENAKNNSAPLGVTSSLSIKQIQTKYEFFKELNISASISGSYGPFSGSGSFSYYSLDEINENSLSWIIIAKGYYGGFALKNPSLSPSAAPLSGLALVEKCGVHYVSQVDRGVVAAALFSVYNLDEKHKQQIQAAMSAGFATGAFSISGAADFASLVKTASQYGSMNIKIFTIGGTGSPGLSTIIKSNPTDLDAIKDTLKTYVENQDINRAAIIGFKTTGLGKLVNDPGIDPDHSNYIYFLEQANSYRLRLLDGLRKVDGIVAKASDFADKVIDNAISVQDKVHCELDYVEQSIQSCRLSYQIASNALVTGDSADREVAKNAMSFGFSADNESGRIRACEAKHKVLSNLYGKPVEATVKSLTDQPFTSLGWHEVGSQDKGAIRDAYQVLDKAGVQKSDNADENNAAARCIAKRDVARSLFSAMLKTAGRSRRTAKKADATTSFCITGCQMVADPQLSKDLSQLPQYPFDVVYWYDSFIDTFGSKAAPGLYVVINKAEKVKQVLFYNAAEADPFAMRYNDGAAIFTAFVDLDKLKDDKNKITRIRVETLSGNLYSIDLPKISPL